MKCKVIAFLVVLLATGCTPQPVVPVAIAETPPPQVLKIFNSKGENSAQFANLSQLYGAETGVKVEAFSVGAGQDHMQPMRDQMDSDTPPVIFSIQGLKEMKEWLGKDKVLDMSLATDPAFSKLAGNIPPSLRLTDNSKDSYGIPYNVEGYGYIADTQMLQELFVADDAHGLEQDLIAATYDEWAAFVLAVETYLAKPSAAKVTLNGHIYTFVPEKTPLTQKLNGVFAVMGAEKWTYGDHFVNVALSAAFVDSLAAEQAQKSQIDALHDVFLVYAKGLDFKTSHMAGANGLATRGADFILPENYGYDPTVAFFAQGKALFLKQGNWALGNIEKVDVAVAKRLTFFPVKMPLTDSDITVPGRTVAKMNTTIPVYVPNYYAINKDASPEEQQMAMDFLVWLNTSEYGKKFIIENFHFIPYNADPETTVLPNSLGNSILSYLKAGDTLSAPYHGFLHQWSGDILGLYVQQNYMTKKEWTQADYEDIANYAVDSLNKLNQSN